MLSDAGWRQDQYLRKRKFVNSYPVWIVLDFFNIDAAEGAAFLFADGRGDRFVRVEDQAEVGFCKLELGTPHAKNVRKCGETLFSLQPGAKGEQTRLLRSKARRSVQNLGYWQVR